MQDNANRTSLPVWSPGCSQLVLLLAGVVAWTAALGLAITDKSDAVATTFVAMGMLLIGAAAFFSRLRELGPQGMKVDPVEIVREVKEGLPPPVEGLAPEVERAGVIDAIETALGDMPISSTPAAPSEAPIEAAEASADLGAFQYEWAIKLDLAARDWFEIHGFSIEASYEAGVSLITRNGAEIYAVEVKSSRMGAGGPTPEALRDGFLKARIWVDENIGTEGAFFRVLVTDVVPPPPLRDRFRSQGIGVTHIDPDTEEVNVILHPKDVRE